MPETQQPAQSRRTFKSLFGGWSDLASVGISLGVTTLVIFWLVLAGGVELLPRTLAVSIAFTVGMVVLFVRQNRKEKPERPLAQNVGMGILRATSAGILFFALMSLWP